MTRFQIIFADSVRSYALSSISLSYELAERLTASFKLVHDGISNPNASEIAEECSVTLYCPNPIVPFVIDVLS